MPTLAMAASLFSRSEEVHQLEHHGGDVGEHVLERVADAADALVAHEVGQSGNRGQRGHDEADRRAASATRSPSPDRGC